MEKADPDRLQAAQSWIDWASGLSPYVSSYGPRHGPEYPLSEQDILLMGYFIQACAEKPDDFVRMFGPILWDASVNPLTSNTADQISNIIGNGVNDDWCIYAQWREQGYVVVNESESRAEDFPLTMNPEFTMRLLDNIAGGLRTAPGDADEAALVQAMFELQPAAGQATDRWDDEAAAGERARAERIFFLGR